MKREDRREFIFLDDGDRRLFLETLIERSRLGTSIRAALIAHGRRRILTSLVARWFLALLIDMSVWMKIPELESGSPRTVASNSKFLKRTKPCLSSPT